MPVDSGLWFGVPGRRKAPEPKVAKNRVHLDVPIGAGDLDAEVERLVARGATFVEHNSHPGVHWADMKDPEGNELCVH